MPLPKRRFSRARRDKRRLQLNLIPPTLSRCANCGVAIRSHRICPACGYYRGRQVILVKSQEKKKN